MTQLTKPPRNDNEISLWRRIVTDILLGRLQHGRTWTDVYPTAVSVGIGSAAPSFTAYDGNLEAREFVGISTTKQIMVEFQFPHTRKDGSDIVPHLHLYVPDDATGGTIKFGCEYEWSNTFDTGAVSTTTVYGTISRAANAGISQNHILSFGTIAGEDMGLSSLISCRIFRDPADAEDTFGSSVWLRSADIHAQMTWWGSLYTFSRTET